MRVADLQQFIRSLLPPLQSAGANSKVTAEIEAACIAIGPFEDRTIGEFADFLRRAEEFDRTGVVPVEVKAASKPRTPKKDTEPSYSTEDAIRDVHDLYERGVGDDVTYAMIEEGVKRLDKLKKADLDAVTSQFGLGKLKTKPMALDAIRQKISNHKRNHQTLQGIR